MAAILCFHEFQTLIFQKRDKKLSEEKLRVIIAFIPFLLIWLVMLLQFCSPLN